MKKKCAKEALRYIKDNTIIGLVVEVLFHTLYLL